METLEDKLKYEIARELGLLEKIKKVGWAGLTAKETGRIGGMITVKKKLMKRKLEKEKEL
ncbi:spore protein [Caloranaerobacter sp. TR13]|nr:spore protein [Caloranaerobacter sp. TR13]